MKIALTGHTSGIGKALYDILSQEHEVVCFSRSNGYDIKYDITIEKIVQGSLDCDVFINNAWDNDCQTKLLKFFFDKWKDQSKKIMSIGSSVASYNPSGSGYSDYVDLKRELRTAHCDIVNLKTTKCKSYLVNPGVTDTNLTADQNRKKMTVQEVADMIKFVLDNKLYVPEIYFYVE